MQRIAQCLTWYLPPTMGYIYDQLMALGLNRSVVLAAYSVEPERFPYERLYIPPPLDEFCHSSSAGRVCSRDYDSLWRVAIEGERVAAMHIHDGRAGMAFWRLGKQYRLPVIVSFLGRDVSADLDDVEYVRSLQVLFDESDLFTVVSQQMAERAQELGCPKAKILVIRQGIPLQRFRFSVRRVPEDERPVLLTVGRLVAKKGLDILARAFVLLCRRHPSVVLRVIGEGPMAREMECILSEAKVRERAVFMGCVEPQLVAAEMSRAHVFCLPCRVGPDGDSEGIPNALKEAMASGLPVVSTYHAGIPELVEHGISGYLVPEGEPEILCEWLLRLLQEPERWEAMGRAGRTKVEMEYSLDAIARQLEEEVYRPLLDKRSPGR